MRRFQTIADGLARSDDNFLLLRFLAAALVIYGHAPVIGGHETQDLFLRLNWGRYSGAIAVDLFFVISGFLVSASWLRNAHLGRFLRARALRIVPAYAACILACAFVVGPLFTTLSPRDYFSNAQTWDYALANLHFGPRLAWWLPGVFSDHAVAVVNGSIWTLPVEVFMYACVAVAGVLAILARRAIVTALLAITFVLVAAFVEPTVKPIIAEYLHMAGLFALGSACYVYTLSLHSPSLLGDCATQLRIPFCSHWPKRPSCFGSPTNSTEHHRVCVDSTDSATTLTDSICGAIRRSRFSSRSRARDRCLSMPSAASASRCCLRSPRGISSNTPPCDGRLFRASAKPPRPCPARADAAANAADDRSRCR